MKRLFLLIPKGINDFKELDFEHSIKKEKGHLEGFYCVNENRVPNSN